MSHKEIDLLLKAQAQVEEATKHLDKCKELEERNKALLRDYWKYVGLAALTGFVLGAWTCWTILVTVR